MSENTTPAQASDDAPRGDVARDEAEAKKPNQLVVILSVALCLAIGAAFLYWASPGSEFAPTTGSTPAIDAQGLKRITLGNFQEEVVAPSEAGPVVIEFYSHL